MTLDEAIKHCEEVAEKNEKECKNWTYGASQINDDESRRKQYLKHAEMWHECAEEYRQLAEWLKELKWYREDTRFADLYERICIKRDDDREYFARTKDKTYITRIAEKEMFIHMMQDMMFDRYGVEEVNADDTKRCDN